MENRLITNAILIHHSDSPPETTMEQVDQWHRKQGFAMIGYHKYIQMDGLARDGRPDWAIGAHSYSRNKDSLGICLAGDFTTYAPTEAQMQSLVAEIKDYRRLYGNIPVQRHGDNDATACPGDMFPWGDLLSRLDNKEVSEEMNIDEALAILKDKGIISSPDYWKMASQVVQYLSNLIIAVANYVK